MLFTVIHIANKLYTESEQRTFTLLKTLSLTSVLCEFKHLKKKNLFYTYLVPPIVACIYYWSKCLDPDYKMTPYIRNNMVIDYQNNCLLQQGT